MSHQDNVSIITMETIKSGLNIADDDTAFDERLERIVAGVSRSIESFLNRPVTVRAHVEELFDGDGTTTMLLVPRIVDITTLINNETTVASDDYVFYADSGEVALTDGTVFVRGRKKVSVTYRNGWEPVDIPEGILLGAETWAIHLFNLMKNDRVGVQSTSKRDQSISYSSSTKMPDAVREMIEGYRLVGFGG